MAGPQDRAAADGDRLRAAHADRERVIEALKVAFVQGRLTTAELDTRAGQALSARTYADLAALTADIPAAAAGTPPAAPARPPAPARRGPLTRAAAGSGGCLVIAAAAVMIAFQLGPDATPAPYASWAKYFLLIAVAAIFTAVGIAVYGVGTWVEQRQSRKQPPGPGPSQNRADPRAHKSQPAA